MLLPVVQTSIVMNDTALMNWKGYERKWLWANLRYYIDVCLNGLRKATKTLCHENRPARRGLNPKPVVYDAEMLTTRPRSSVICRNSFIHWN